MRIAETFGCPLGEAKKKITNREFRTWKEHFRLEVNRPGRNEFYLMKLMAIQMAKPPSDLNSLKVKVTFEDERKTFEWTQEGADAAARTSKATWFGRMGSKLLKKARGK